MLVWWTLNWGFRVKVEGVNKGQSGIGEHHAVTTTTHILTGKVACSMGVPYGKKHKPGILADDKTVQLVINERHEELRGEWLLEIKVLDQIAAGSFAAFSTPVCAEYLSHAGPWDDANLAFIWQFIVTCRSGEENAVSHGGGVAAKPSPCPAENWSRSLWGRKLEHDGQMTVQKFSV